MDDLAVKACDGYRIGSANTRFVTYFRQATPEPELASLPLGQDPHDADKMAASKHYVLFRGYLPGARIAWCYQHGWALAQR